MLVIRGTPGRFSGGDVGRVGRGRGGGGSSCSTFTGSRRCIPIPAALPGVPAAAVGAEGEDFTHLLLVLVI